MLTSELSTDDGPSALATNSDSECHPICTLDELLAIQSTPIVWHSLVEPLDPAVRSQPRWLGNAYADFDAADDVASRIGDEASRPKVLVCHDMMGNYRGDRFVNGSTKWDDYRFYHWPAIDTFCYFSHSFVTVPPLGWLQAAHRHGVAVLGTIITESAGGAQTLQRLLHDDASIAAAVEALVHLAHHCRFEGWLVNIECALPEVYMPRLLAFVRQLHERMHARVPHAQVIWYDSILAKTGQLHWQNELNSRNRPFFDVCDGILLNYNWTSLNLMRSSDEVRSDPAAVARIYAGIDVFGRGQVAQFQTHTTLARIRGHSPHMSVAVFAPGWTFEASAKLGVNIHTRRGTDVCNAYFVERNERFWELLWPMMWVSGPARMPFRTWFCLGSGKQRHRDGVLKVPVQGWWDLRRQAWQPSVPGGRGWSLQFAEAFSGGSCLKVCVTAEVRRLFVANFSGADVWHGFVLSYAFKSPFGGEALAVWLRLVGPGGRVCRVECGEGGGGGDNGNDGPPHAVRLRPLVGDDLRAVLVHIAERGEHSLPAGALQSDATTQTGWLVRYYYVNVADELGTDAEADAVRVRDVGVRATDGSVYLGALHLHGGGGAGVAATLLDSRRQHWRKITAADFQ